MTTLRLLQRSVPFSRSTSTSAGLQARGVTILIWDNSWTVIRLSLIDTPPPKVISLGCTLPRKLAEDRSHRPEQFESSYLMLSSTSSTTWGSGLHSCWSKSDWSCSLALWASTTNSGRVRKTNFQTSQYAVLGVDPINAAILRFRSGISPPQPGDIARISRKRQWHYMGLVRSRRQSIYGGRALVVTQRQVVLACPKTLPSLVRRRTCSRARTQSDLRPQPRQPQSSSSESSARPYRCLLRSLPTQIHHLAPALQGHAGRRATDLHQSDSIAPYCTSALRDDATARAHARSIIDQQAKGASASRSGGRPSRLHALLQGPCFRLGGGSWATATVASAAPVNVTGDHETYNHPKRLLRDDNATARYA
jgi:hypothetical protein